MTIPTETLALIKSFEGYLKRLPDGRAAPYRCPAGVPTIGFGSVWRWDWSPVAMSDPPITREEAEALLAREIERKCEPAVDTLIAVALHPLSRGALVSFVYNLGAGSLRGSGLRRAINERRWGDVPAEFAKWRMGGGRVLPGLVRRRAAEAAMFLEGVRALEARGGAHARNLATDRAWTAVRRPVPGGVAAAAGRAAAGRGAAPAGGGRRPEPAARAP